MEHAWVATLRQLLRCNQYLVTSCKKVVFSYRPKRCMEHRAPFGFEKITAWRAEVCTSPVEFLEVGPFWPTSCSSLFVMFPFDTLFPNSKKCTESAWLDVIFAAGISGGSLPWQEMELIPQVLLVRFLKRTHGTTQLRKLLFFQPKNRLDGVKFFRIWHHDPDTATWLHIWQMFFGDT